MGLEGCTVPPERDPYFAFPSLYGAPAYGRPPKPLADATRPFDPDDFPLAAEQSEDESAVLRERGLVGRFHGRAMAAAEPLVASGGVSRSELPARRLRLRLFAGRLRTPGS